MKTKKQKIPSFIILFLFLHFLGFGQSVYNYNNYRKNYNKAQMAKYLKNYKAEKKYYEKAFNYMNQGHIVDLCYDNYIDCLLNNKDTAMAIKAEEKYLTLGLINFVNANSMLKKFGEKFGNNLIDKFPNIKQEYDNLPEKENRISISELEKTDQDIRKMHGTIPQQEFEKLLVFTDSINFTSLYKLVKEKNANPICFLMYHIYGGNKRYFNFYDSIYKSKVFKGEASAEAYVQWYDRQRMYVDGMKTQLYGEWNGQGNGSTTFYPIEDIQNIDKRRAKFGLCTLKDFALMHNLSLPQDYYSSKKKK